MDFIKIASAQNKQLKYAAQLQAKNKFRIQEEKIVLEGFHLLEEAIKQDLGLIQQVFIDSKHLQNTEVKILNQLSIPIYVLAHDLIKKISSTQSSSGIVAIAKKPCLSSQNTNFVAFIENLQDPGNLGTIIRSGSASGLQKIVVDQQSVDPWSSKVLRAGMGGHFKMSIEVTNELVSELDKFEGEVHATVLEGTNLFQTQLPIKTAFVFGNEGQGLSPELKSKIATKVTIPMKNNVESLNAGTAATICFYEYFRQHLN